MQTGQNWQIKKCDIVDLQNFTKIPKKINSIVKIPRTLIYMNMYFADMGASQPAADMPVQVATVESGWLAA